MTIKSSVAVVPHVKLVRIADLATRPAHASDPQTKAYWPCRNDESLRTGYESGGQAFVAMMRTADLIFSRVLASALTPPRLQVPIPLSYEV
jgi:hypothetical protein